MVIPWGPASGPRETRFVRWPAEAPLRRRWTRSVGTTTRPVAELARSARAIGPPGYPFVTRARPASPVRSVKRRSAASNCQLRRSGSPRRGSSPPRSATSPVAALGKGHQPAYDLRRLAVGPGVATRPQPTARSARVVAVKASGLLGLPVVGSGPEFAMSRPAPADELRPTRRLCFRLAATSSFARARSGSSR
jgi:hypothetical protein